MSIRFSRSRHGFTLVEMLVAMALSLLVILAITQVFQLIGTNVARGRAVLEMSGQLRATSERFRRDLQGLTVPARPWPKASSGLGYLMIFEGPRNDQDADNDGILDVRQADPDKMSPPMAFGDTDDMVAFTARSTGVPFLGQVMGQLFDLGDGRFEVITDQNDARYDTTRSPYTVIESRDAEIIWWVALDDKNGNGARDFGEYYVLYRRVQLIRPDLILVSSSNTVNSLASGLTRDEFFNANDLSVRYVGNNPVTNSLSDLTKRENRFAHRMTPFPHRLNTALLIPKSDFTRTIGGFTYTSDQLGEDIMLSHVVALDLRVFDPTVALYANTDGDEALTPGDPGYVDGFGAGAGPIGSGAFVDLFYRSDSNTAGVSTFSNAPSGGSMLSAYGIYDTWSFHYEHDGIDQDGDGTVDQGTNGLDDDGMNGVDDAGERETQPPYSAALRGIEMRIRVIELDSRAVRQTSVRADFTPE